MNWVRHLIDSKLLRIQIIILDCRCFWQTYICSLKLLRRVHLAELLLLACRHSLHSEIVLTHCCRFYSLNLYSMSLLATCGCMSLKPLCVYYLVVCKACQLCLVVLLVELLVHDVVWHIRPWMFRDRLAAMFTNCGTWTSYCICCSNCAIEINFPSGCLTICWPSARVTTSETEPLVF
jgi:hypothetical protein